MECYIFFQLWLTAHAESLLLVAQQVVHAVYVWKEEKSMTELGHH